MTIIKQFEPIEENKKYSKKYIAFCISGLVVLVVLQIWAHNTVARYGDKFSQVSYLQQSLELENQVLENEIAKLSSIHYIASESAKLGFSKPKQVEYVY